MRDPEGTTAGTFSLTIDPPASGSGFVTVTSTGSTVQHPDVKRTIKATFGARSLASHAFLNNSNIWFGQGATVYGEVFSNGGIRMDGTNTSTVKSTHATYTCGIETGCYPDSETKPGVWGNGGPQSLWIFPATPIDFDGISVDFRGMQQIAQTQGVYLTNSGSQGYHVVFNSNGSFTIYKVTATDYRKGYSLEYGCEKLYQVITTEQQLSTYQVSSKPILFAEDTLWVEGVVNGKMTVVAAQFPIDSNNRTIWVNNNITYLAKDGTSSLGLVAQRDIVFNLEIPQTFEVDSALLAQKGRVIRHDYRKTNQPNCSIYQSATRNELIIYGSITSNQQSYWNFTAQGTNTPSSGFIKRTITYDSNLLYQAPPYFPTSGDIDLISWTED